jgi:hypothetical protein
MSSKKAPDPATQLDVVAAFKKRFDEDGFQEFLVSIRKPNTNTPEPPIQFGEVTPGTQPPYVTISTREGFDADGRSSGEEIEGKQYKHSIEWTPVMFKVFAMTDDESDQLCKRMIKSIEKEPLSVCGGQSFVQLRQPHRPVLSKESHELYSMTVTFQVKTDVLTPN